MSQWRLSAAISPNLAMDRLPRFIPAAAASVSRRNMETSLFGAGMAFPDFDLGISEVLKSVGAFAVIVPRSCFSVAEAVVHMVAVQRLEIGRASCRGRV